MVRSKKTGWNYPEPTIPSPTELQQHFSRVQIGDMVILYIQYKDDLPCIYQHFVTKHTKTHVFITHVKQGFAISDGKAHDDDGNRIQHWQLLPYTEEIHMAVRHARLVDNVSHLLHYNMRLLAAMSNEQLTAVKALFEQVESQSPVYPLVNVKEEWILEVERQKILQEEER